MITVLQMKTVKLREGDLPRARKLWGTGVRFEPKLF